MSDFEFAVAGSSPTAILLALCLSETHGKSVCLAGAIPHGLQLTRGIDLQTGPYTRPETWQLITRNIDHVLSLTAVVGPEMWTRTDAAFPARTGNGATALGHVRHMAAAHGIFTEPLVDAHNSNVPGFMARGVLRLQRRRFFETAGKALAAAGIPVFEPGALTVRRNGSGRLAGNGDEVSAGKVILADDAAILAHARGNLFNTVRYRAVLTEPNTPLAWPCTVDLEAGGEIYAHANGAVECAVRVDRLPARTWLAQQLAPGAATRLAGRTSFERVQTVDGAPMAGVPDKGAAIVAGTGVGGLFLVPSIARYLLGRSDAVEKRYFEDRPVQKARATAITDLVSGQAGAA